MRHPLWDVLIAGARERERERLATPTETTPFGRAARGRGRARGRGDGRGRGGRGGTWSVPPQGNQHPNAVANAHVARRAQERAAEQERKDWVHNYMINHADMFLPESATPSVGARVMHKETG